MKTLRLVALVAVALVTAAPGLAAESPLSNEGIHYTSMWGRQGPGPGEFHYPFDVAVDSDGFVYVTDTGNHRVQRNFGQTAQTNSSPPLCSSCFI